jgi:hypothetical protein
MLAAVNHGPGPKSGPAEEDAMKKPKPIRCRRCGKKSNYVGAMSGNCPRCQNAEVAELERDLGMKRGELGRVNSRGE